ncbi:MAG TPA: SMP-30/gluconolactonase/LRE family protein [Noviherbaspirillum sp.]|uniref:SMP-30/gluconolactonase/LRE family protein n=1 Tax=Noviherbaspirillum sp. TaxID=1926288 RepID=UPI002D552824|nr:SMP-30/gluconolactonase/LRE family protein [Noviherbaspirillum sp.]HYD96737.1 SMP-30/gluconolactonase/LRE family protein [Noviherbaspirillum sp.]
MTHHLKKTTSMPDRDIRVLFDQAMLLGETPLWHPEEEALYWIDIAGQAVLRYRPENEKRTVWPMPAEPGCIAWCAGGKLLVALRTGLVLLDTRSGMLEPVAPPPYPPEHTRFNDGRCDALGRLWVGTLYDPRDQPLGSLYCVERGLVRPAGKPVTVSNGLAFSMNYRTMYHADTTAHRIRAYDFDLRAGTLSGTRDFMQFSADRNDSYGGRPDGAAVDSENAYWCAMYEGGRILRISPEGEILREIQLPARCPTMVAFGGPDFRTLFITTVSNKRSVAELQEYPLSGCVLCMRVDVPGRPEPPYIP